MDNKEPKYMETIRLQEELANKMVRQVPLGIQMKLPTIPHVEIPQIYTQTEWDRVRQSMAVLAKSATPNLDYISQSIAAMQNSMVDAAKVMAFINTDLFTETLEPIKKTLSQLTNTINLNVQSQLSDTVQRLMQATFNPLIEIIRKFDLDFNYDLFEKEYLSCMYECRWFPYIHDGLSIDFIYDILDIENHTHAIKSRTRKINSYIFSLFTKNRLKSIKRDWAVLEKNKVRSRILRQAIDAHLNKKYALVVFALIPLWEAIILEKVNFQGRMTSRMVKDSLCALVNSNDLPQIVAEFYIEYIMYQCDSIEDVKPDVPGRHASSHGWIKNYPTRKSVLDKGIMRSEKKSKFPMYHDLLTRGAHL